MFYLYVSVLIFFSATILAQEDCLVSLEDGLVEGTHKTSYNGRKFVSFEGIPFAAPPVQKLRFRDPQPVGKWDGILKATNTYTCLQYKEGSIRGSEDCLYLNVYVPREKISPHEKLDVIIHIHGGSFMVGSGHASGGPSKLMDRDVVYVNLNYRLGPLGFLASEDRIFSGNYGLKDQVAALRWVQRNIAKFGGNPNSVTITGMSAGAASVHLQYFAHNTEEVLFHRGWAMSGTALNSWAVKRNPWIAAKTLITHVGCFNESTDVALRCMRQRSALQVVGGLKAIYKGPRLPLVPFAPVVELLSQNNPKPFMTSHPYVQLMSGHVRNVPLVISQTTDEGLFPSIFYYEKLDSLNKNWKRIVPMLFDYFDVGEEEQEQCSEKIKDFYFKNETITEENFKYFIEACTHRIFHLEAEKSAKIQASVSTENVYFMLLGYAGDNGILKPSYNTRDLDGAPHTLDLKFLFDVEVLKDIPLTADEERMKDVYLDLLVTYAKTGVPNAKNVTWEPVLEKGNLKYLFVKSPDDIHMRSTKQLGPFEFWQSLGLKENENF